MALASYSDLQDSIPKWANRVGAADFTAMVPDFIVLAEATIGRRVRRKTIRRTVQITSDTFQLPGDCGELRSARLVTGIPGRDVALDIVTVEALDDYRTALDPSGYPRWGAVVDGTLLLVPGPSATFDAELTYYEKLVPLSGTNTSNSILAEAPDIYLYASLLAAAPYSERDDRVETWKGALDQAIDELNIKREREEFGASLRPVRLPRVFG